jgi:hypothetical protein
VVAYSGGRLVGLAAYERHESELRAYEFGVDEEASCGVPAVVATLLDALEVACLAGGCRRLAITLRAMAGEQPLLERGFHIAGPASSSRMFVKAFPV